MLKGLIREESSPRSAHDTLFPYQTLQASRIRPFPYQTFQNVEGFDTRREYRCSAVSLTKHEDPKSQTPEPKSQFLDRDQETALQEVYESRGKTRARSGGASKGGGLWYENEFTDMIRDFAAGEKPQILNPEP